MKDEVQGKNLRKCRGCGCHAYDNATGCFVCDMDAENIAATPTPIADSSEHAYPVDTYSTFL